MQGVQVRSLTGELRSHVQRGVARKQKLRLGGLCDLSKATLPPGKQAAGMFRNGHAMIPTGLSNLQFVSFNWPP